MLKQLEWQHSFQNDDRQQIDKAHNEAEALFRPKPQSNESSTPGDPPRVDLSARKPRILSASASPGSHVAAKVPIISGPQTRPAVSVSSSARRERLNTPVRRFSNSCMSSRQSWIRSTPRCARSMPTKRPRPANHRSGLAAPRCNIAALPHVHEAIKTHGPRSIGRVTRQSFVMTRPTGRATARSAGHRQPANARQRRFTPARDIPA